MQCAPVREAEEDADILADIMTLFDNAAFRHDLEYRRRPYSPLLHAAQHMLGQDDPPAVHSFIRNTSQITLSLNPDPVFVS